MKKVYDRAYFDHWYRDPENAPSTPAQLRRKAALAIATAEYYLGREIRNVLDVGCGEGAWLAPLRQLRSKIDYLGMDSSDYVVERYGRTRNLRKASFGQLGELRFDSDFDLIVCSDVMHYIRAAELRHGLRGIAGMLAGVAFLELFTSADAPEGDKHGFIARPAGWYRKVFAEAGLFACGSHCYLGPKLRGCVTSLEMFPD